MKRLVLASLLIASPVFAGEDDHDHDEIAHKVTFEGLEILHPWTNAGHGDHATVFMELTNTSETEIAVLGARTEAGAEGPLIGFMLKDGEMAFEPLPAIPIAAGQSLDLKPGELAIRLDGLEADLEEGHHLEVLLLTSVGEVEIDVMIEPEDARQHSHAGHNH
jgi:copper(I)-binding protein